MTLIPAHGATSPDMSARFRRSVVSYDDEAGALQMLDQTLRHDLRHDLVGVVDALTTLKAQREGERVGEVASFSSLL